MRDGLNDGKLGKRQREFGEEIVMQQAWFVDTDAEDAASNGYHGKNGQD